jgi:hypothetical protein
MEQPPQRRAHRPRRRILIPALLALLALASGWASAQPPMPLDPLTPEEQQEAATLAQADPRVTSLLGPGRSVLAAVEFITLQKGSEEDSDPERPLPIGRFAQVLFARYEGNLGVRALVDLVADSVTVVESISGDDVPMSLAELNAAWALARQDPAVRQVIPETDLYQVLQDPNAPEPSHRVEGLRVVGTQSGERCFEHRCLALLFQRLDEYLANIEVLVDLTTQTVTVSTTETGGEAAASHQHPPIAARRKP